MTLTPVGSEPVLAGPSDASFDKVPTAGCRKAPGWKLVSQHYDRRVRVGAAFSTLKGVEFKYKFTTASTANLGVGLSLTGPSAGYSVSGSSSVSANKSANFGAKLSTSNFKVSYSTEFTYGKYKSTCPDSKRHHLRPTAHEGGAVTATLATAMPSSNGRCDRYTKDGGTTLDRSDATTWTVGASVSSLIGINLSSQSGYSDSTKFDVTFKEKAGYLCGTHGSLSGTPGSLIAKP